MSNKAEDPVRAETLVRSHTDPVAVDAAKLANCKRLRKQLGFDSDDPANWPGGSVSHGAMAAPPGVAARTGNAGLVRTIWTPDGFVS